MGIAKQNAADAEEVQKPSIAIRDEGFNFDDARLMSGAWRNETNVDMCKEFFRCLAICHTVLPEGEETPDKLQYQAASPDEAALLTAAKNFGFFFYRRTPTMVYVRESHVEKMGKVQDVSYEILNVLEFNSTRKRQSVVCRYKNGRLVLYCKLTGDKLETSINIAYACKLINNDMKQFVISSSELMKSETMKAEVTQWRLLGL